MPFQCPNRRLPRCDNLPPWSWAKGNTGFFASFGFDPKKITVGVSFWRISIWCSQMWVQRAKLWVQLVGQESLPALTDLPQEDVSVARNFPEWNAWSIISTTSGLEVGILIELISHVWLFDVQLFSSWLRKCRMQSILNPQHCNGMTPPVLAYFFRRFRVLFVGNRWSLMLL